MRFKCPFCEHEPFFVFWALKQHAARDHADGYCPVCKIDGVRGIESHLLQHARIEASKVGDVMSARAEDIPHIIMYGLITRSKIFSANQTRLPCRMKELATIVAFNKCICDSEPHDHPEVRIEVQNAQPI